jgi:hypothetical protein
MRTFRVLTAPVRRQNLVSQEIQAFEGSAAMDHRDINPAL